MDFCRVALGPCFIWQKVVEKEAAPFSSPSRPDTELSMLSLVLVLVMIRTAHAT